MNQLQIQSLFHVSEVEITYRNKIPYQDRIPILKSSTAYEILRHAWDENKIELVEQFKILLVDNKNNCIGVADISTGSISACIVDPRIVFAIALKSKATGIILSHNHPSGNLRASEEDQKVTQKLWQGGKILDITVLDHIIMTPQNYFSFADHGIMPR